MFTLVLHFKGVGGLEKRIGRVHILLLSATKEAPAATGAGQELLGLDIGKLSARRGRGYEGIQTFWRRARGS